MKFLLLFAALGMLVRAETQPAQPGSPSLIIEYRAFPADRTKLHQAMIQPGHGLQRFEDWRRAGAIESYQVLFSRYLDTDIWDMLVVANFAKDADTALWRRVERQFPAGLSGDMLAWMSSVHTYPTDFVRGRAGSDSSVVHPVFLATPVQFDDPKRYLRYFDETLKPQFDALIEEGVLTRYQLHIQRYRASRPWDALLLLHFKDDESLAARDLALAKVRARLNMPKDGDPPPEKQVIVADQLIIIR